MLIGFVFFISFNFSFSFGKLFKIFNNLLFIFGFSFILLIIFDIKLFKTLLDELVFSV